MAANAMPDNGLNNLDSTTGDKYVFFIDKMDENIKIKTTQSTFPIKGNVPGNVPRLKWPTFSGTFPGTFSGTFPGP